MCCGQGRVAHTANVVGMSDRTAARMLCACATVKRPSLISGTAFSLRPNTRRTTMRCASPANIHDNEHRFRKKGLTHERFHAGTGAHTQAPPLPPTHTRTHDMGIAIICEIVRATQTLSLTDGADALCAQGVIVWQCAAGEHHIRAIAFTVPHRSVHAIHCTHGPFAQRLLCYDARGKGKGGTTSLCTQNLTQTPRLLGPRATVLQQVRHTG